MGQAADAGRASPKGRTARFLRALGLGFAQTHRHFDGALPLLPIPVAALAPFREILLPDLRPAELRRQDRLHRRQAVQPGHEDVAVIPLAEAFIQGVPDFPRQPGDFTCSLHGFFTMG